MLNDVRFEVQPNAAMKIAKGGQKGTIATMEGYWEPITRELAEEMGPELMRDPRWVQAGMDPTRSASFYNRETMQPIVEGEQVLHSGPLVLVKNPLYGDIEDFPFKEGGEVRAAKGGILGVLAKTAEKGMEKAVKAAKVDIPPMGINVRTDSKLNIPFADLIVDGQKVYESRKNDSLRPYVNKSMSIVRTGKGPAKAIGAVEIGEPMVVDAKTFREMQDKHLVPEGSMFDIDAEGQKYLYPLSNSRRFDQEFDVGHGIKARKVILPDDMDKKKGGKVTIDEFLKRMKER
jgi:hypothetical protein